MFKLEDISRDQQGRALSGIAVYVLDHTSGLTVTIYEDDDTTPKANPLTSDANGYCHCRVPAGTYKLRATYNGGTVERTKITVADTATVGSITFTATDRLLGRQSAGGGAGEEITCTAAGRALLDDATAADQRSTLGLGTCATQNTNSMTITGGAISGITDLAVADGGTGASTASGARTNLGAQTSSAGLTSFSAVAAAASADKLAYFTAANTLAETGLTTAGRALLDDATAADQRTTLGLGTSSTQNANNVAITGGTIGIDDGSAASPSLFFKNDTDTGLRSESANTLGVVIGGVSSASFISTAFTKRNFNGVANLTMRRANNTEASPTLVASGDTIGSVTWQGYYDNGAGGVGYGAPASIAAIAAENYASSTNLGTYIRFATTAAASGTPVAQSRIDPNGTFVLNDRNGHAGFTAGTIRPRLQGYSNAIATAALSSTTFSASASLGGSLFLGHMRGAVDSFSAVTTGDTLGRIAAEGADGTDLAQAVVIRFRCEGTIADNQVPGLFELHTANASGTLTTALTVNSSQTCTVLGTTDSTTKDTGALICEGGVGVEKSVVAGIGLNAANKFRIHYDSSTGEWGPQAKLTNKTGGNTVKGQIVIASTGTDMAFNTAPISSDAPIGVIYEAGVADASDAWVWMEGAVCQVLLKDGTASTRGYWAAVSDTAGRADITNAAPVTATHPQEIGHCLESQGSGTSVLARVNLHFQ